MTRAPIAPFVPLCEFLVESPRGAAAPRFQVPEIGDLYAKAATKRAVSFQGFMRLFTEAVDGHPAQRSGEPMHSIIVILKVAITIPLLFFLPGFFLLRVRRAGQLDVDWIERVMLMLLTSVGISAIVILFSAEAGILRLWFVDAVLLVIAVAIRAVGGRYRRPVPRPGVPALALGLLIVLAVVCSLFFFTPHQWVTGDGDPGINFNVASNMAASGTVKISDSRLSSMTPAEQTLFAHEDTFVGMLLKHQGSGEIVMRLYHMLPSWMAVFMKLFGTLAGLYVIPLFALFNILLLFAIGRRLAGTFCGFCAAVLLASSGIFLWFARLSESEILLQFFLFGVLLLLVLYVQHKQSMYPLLFGITLMAALLTKVEALVYVIPVYLMFLVAMLAGKYDRTDRRMVLGAFAATAVALVYTWALIPATFVVLVPSTLNIAAPGRNFILLPLALATVATLFFEVDAVNRLLARIGRAVKTLLKQAKLARVHWFGLIGGLAFFAWFLYLYTTPGSKPVFISASTNVLRLSWMMGGALLLLAVAAFCAMLYWLDARISMLLLSVAVLTIYIFMLRYIGNGGVLLVTRRYVTLFAPMLLLGVGFVAAVLWRQRNLVLKAAAVALVIALIVAFVPLDRVILSNTQYAGAEQSLANAAGAAPAATVVLRGRALASLIGIPMRYRFGKDFQRLHESPNMTSLLETTVGKRQAEGRPLYFAGTYDDVYDLAPALQFTGTGQSFEFNYTALKSFYFTKPAVWGLGKYHLDYMSMAPGRTVTPATGATCTLDLAADPLHCFGYITGFLYQQVPNDTIFWIKGSDATVLAGLARRDPEVLRWLATGANMSRVKIPVPKSDHEVVVEIDVWCAARSANLQALANGHPLIGSRTDAGKGSFVYRYVIKPADQGGKQQEIVLMAPLAPERGATQSYPTSGLSLGRVRATVDGAP
jgi:hypothetical protein